MRQLLAREEEARGEGELEEWTQGELVNWYLEQREDLVRCAVLQYWAFVLWSSAEYWEFVLVELCVVVELYCFE
eukprot:3078843-Rhodomonas_salina.1